MSISKVNRTPQEAASFGAFGGGWNEGTKLDVSNATEQVAALDKDCDRILWYSDTDCYLRFDTDTGDQITSDSPPLVRAGVADWIEVPGGLRSGDKTIQMHVQQVVSQASRTFWYVEQ